MFFNGKLQTFTVNMLNTNFVHPARVGLGVGARLGVGIGAEVGAGPGQESVRACCGWKSDWAKVPESLYFVYLH
jgi:hypothetical protein